MKFRWKYATRLVLELTAALAVIVGIIVMFGGAFFQKNVKLALSGLGLMLVGVYVMLGFSDNGD